MKPPEIKILPDDVANKIAAGEVVERPASVVKELLENSIDAGATRIDIEFKHGGKTFIKVLDNGCGMTRQQALMSLEQHATSKIRSPEDLFSISSYGFRGEAVPSIASVSKFRMRTRPEGESVGTQIDSYASQVLSVKECGMPRGTEILVENLFSGVPARRKFLKSDNVGPYCETLPPLRARPPELVADSRRKLQSAVSFGGGVRRNCADIKNIRAGDGGKSDRAERIAKIRNESLGRDTRPRRIFFDFPQHMRIYKWQTR